jgi:uncharacterized lipoprotein YddW (UPF0748 family)
MLRLMICSALVAISGCGGAPLLDAGPTDAPPFDARPLDALDAPEDLPSDAGPPPVVVSHRRELRAVWVATVSRLDFPSAAGLSAAQIEAELSAIVDRASEAGLNAIFFQVRPESDALYASTIEPWSRFLTGTQGRDPGYDPLGILLTLAHARGLEVHAWMNPLRGMTSTTVSTDPSHVSNTLSDAAIVYGSGITMNPADPEVRAHVVDVVVDLLQHYDVDGVVFDDYFYPYPDGAGSPFPDAASYSAYTAGGGTLSRSDWRRENVNQLVEATAAAIEAEEPWVRFGISPFGIYRPGMPAGVVGLDAYEVISCDSVRWIEQGWVDYLAPQLYWPSTSTGQPFGDLIDWWARRGSEERPVLASIGAYRLGAAAAWTVDEIQTQITLTRDAGAGAAGHTFFRDEHLEGSPALRAMLAAEYAIPARPPRVPGMSAVVLAPPTATLVSGALTLGHAREAELSGYAIYRQAGASYALTTWVPRGVTPPSLDAGTYAVSAIDRAGVESGGTELVVP